MTDTSGPILEIEKLNIRFKTAVGIVHAVRDVSFAMGREKPAIVGESGSGKSQTGRAILGLTPGKVTAQKLAFHGRSLLGLTPAQWREIRGKRIAMVMQDPKYSLNPVMTIGEQLLEACARHQGAAPRPAARARHAGCGADPRSGARVPRLAARALAAAWASAP